MSDGISEEEEDWGEMELAALQGRHELWSGQGRLPPPRRAGHPLSPGDGSDKGGSQIASPSAEETSGSPCPSAQAGCGGMFWGGPDVGTALPPGDQETPLVHVCAHHASVRVNRAPWAPLVS